MPVTEHCPRHHTPIGFNGCQVCRNQPIPMPEWFKEHLVRLGIRPATPDDKNTNTDRAEQR